MRKDRLMVVREKILAHSQNFKYSCYIGRPGNDKMPESYKELFHNCGTVGCVIGFTLAVSGDDTMVHGEGILAQNYLGLDTEQANFLFYCLSGFGEGAREFHETDFTEAIKRIDILLAL